jgi:hypothetical protein
VQEKIDAEILHINYDEPASDFFPHLILPTLLIATLPNYHNFQSIGNYDNSLPELKLHP